VLLNGKSWQSVLALYNIMHDKRHLNHYAKFIFLVFKIYLKTYLCNRTLLNQVFPCEKVKKGLT